MVITYDTAVEEVLHKTDTKLDASVRVSLATYGVFGSLGCFCGGSNREDSRGKVQI